MLYIRKFTPPDSYFAGVWRQGISEVIVLTGPESRIVMIGLSTIGKKTGHNPWHPSAYTFHILMKLDILHQIGLLILDLLSPKIVRNSSTSNLNDPDLRTRV